MKLLSILREIQIKTQQPTNSIRFQCTNKNYIFLPLNTVEDYIEDMGLEFNWRQDYKNTESILKNLVSYKDIDQILVANTLSKQDYYNFLLQEARLDHIFPTTIDVDLFTDIYSIQDYIKDLLEIHPSEDYEDLLENFIQIGRAHV